MVDHVADLAVDGHAADTHRRYRDPRTQPYRFNGAAVATVVMDAKAGLSAIRN